MWRYKLYRDDPGIVVRAREQLIKYLGPVGEVWKSIKTEPQKVWVKNPEYPDTDLATQKLSGLAVQEMQMVITEVSNKTVTRQSAPWAIKMVLGPVPFSSVNPDADGDDIETVDFEFEEV